jgi:hypothetical protein
MIPGHGKQLSTRLLILYMISTLLFLTSIDLHIHPDDGSVAADNEAAVHISSLAGDITSTDKQDEISISPDGVLKVKEADPGVSAVFLFATLIALLCSFECVRRIRDIRTRFPERPFHGTPSQRAPPPVHA